VKGQIRVFDVARHIVEPRELWAERLAAPFRNEVRLGDGPLDLMVAGRSVQRASPALRSRVARASTDLAPVANLTIMDHQGVDGCLCLPTAGLSAVWADHVDADLSVGICRAYNDWLQEYCGTDRRRLKPAALLPLQDPTRAALELRRSVVELGCVGAVLHTSPLLGRGFASPVYAPLYREAEELEVPLILTQLSGTVLPQLGRDRFDSTYAREAVAHTFEIMLAVIAFMRQGIVDDYPRLKVVFVGAGCGWLPYWLDRLDEHWGGPLGGDEIPCPYPPGYYFRNHGFAASAPWESTLSNVVSEVGDAVVVWGSGHPLVHAGDARESLLDGVMSDHDLQPDQRARILWGNAANLFCLDNSV
jgi:predicted TIM-barrel fold metal-dependent hydrolase